MKTYRLIHENLNEKYQNKKDREWHEELVLINIDENKLKTEYHIEKQYNEDLKGQLEAYKSNKITFSNKYGEFTISQFCLINLMISTFDNIYYEKKDIKLLRIKEIHDNLSDNLKQLVLDNMVVESNNKMLVSRLKSRKARKTIDMISGYKHNLNNALERVCEIINRLENKINMIENVFNNESIDLMFIYINQINDQIEKLNKLKAKIEEDIRIYNICI